MRIEIQNYLYRLSADVGLSTPVFESSGNMSGNGYGESDWNTNPSSNYNTNTNTNANNNSYSNNYSSPSKNNPNVGYNSAHGPGKLLLSQQVDTMHYRLEDLHTAMAAIKDDTDHNNTYLQQCIRQVENKLEEIGISNQTSISSVTTRASHIEELLRSLELQYYKLVSDSKEELNNKLREVVLNQSDDRNNLERRVALVEGVMASITEKNRVSYDTIDAYFASSKDIKKFELVCFVYLFVLIPIIVCIICAERNED